MGIGGLRFSHATLDEAGMGWIEPVDPDEDEDEPYLGIVLGYN